MGYAADAAGVVQSGEARELQLSTSAIEPKPTSKVTINANLDSRSLITQPAAGPGIDFNDANTYNSATSVNAVDANGKDVVLTMYFQKTAAETWDIYATANGEPVGGVPAVPITTMTFPGTGAAPISPAAPLTVNVPAGTVTNGVGTLPISGLLVDLTGFTQFAAPFGVTKLDQDGYGAGALSGVVVEPSGLIRANYTNGRSRSIGQIELATFSNMNGLQPSGGNEWSRTVDAGDPVLGVPGSGNLGSLQTSALEDSNVDLTSELVNMMIAQRTYQANAQTIKTQDQVLQTLVNMR
jgi:flagellar hook protein FlgE